MRLFHFSDDPGISCFEPRPVLVPSLRPVGREWLNGPLVWAIDEPHSMMYLFPRDCPRILIWPLAHTTAEDRFRWMGDTSARAVAYIEAGWFERLQSEMVYRYEMPGATFESLEDAGMYVSRTAVRPLGCEALISLDTCLAAADVELRVLEDLASLRSAWNSTLHVSGIRLRNATNWA